jgi:hypothetical protein
MRAVSPLAASIGSLYQEGIVETGREAQFLFFIAFLATFGFIRTSTHMIRAQVSWWPGNVSVGGTHIHHLVWGILMLLVFGWIGVAVHPGSPWREITAVFFGIGAGLTMDEFALWLNLKDVYWEKQGRRSIDAVIVTAAIAGLLTVGFRGWIDAASSVEEEVFAFVGGLGVSGVLLALVNVSKEKFGMALVGLFFPPVGIAGALRLAKPNSLFARSYGRKRLERARSRFKGARGEPFWRRRGELLGRLRLARGSGSRGTP